MKKPYTIEKFGKRLLELRKEKGLTTRQLADKLGFSQTAISNWENLNREPSLTYVVKLAQYFDVSVGYMAGTED
ncbi:MAG: helix-turn-helix domain-containing protein [Firmicutes bacterium]|nr:helix-turn-helix domain-containing protein [Bacillota bacterium]